MPAEFQLRLTFDEMAKVRDALIKARDDIYLGKDIEYLTKYEWAVDEYKRSLHKREELATLLEKAFGYKADTTEDLKGWATLAEAARLRESLKALEDEEAEADA